MIRQLPKFGEKESMANEYIVYNPDTIWVGVLTFLIYIILFFVIPGIIFFVMSRKNQFRYDLETIKKNKKKMK